MSHIRQEDIDAYRAALSDGAVREVYQGLLRFMRNLATSLAEHEPRLKPGALHVGAMDVTFIPLHPVELKARKIKVLVMFFHASFRFEVWLAGVNKTSQSLWWDKFRGGGFTAAELADAPTADHYFVRDVLADEPSFDDPDQLTGELVGSTAKFVSDIEAFLAEIE